MDVCPAVGVHELLPTPEDIKTWLRWGLSGNNGAAGMFEQDDIDNWRSVTESAKSPLARK